MSRYPSVLLLLLALFGAASAQGGLRTPLDVTSNADDNLRLVEDSERGLRRGLEPRHQAEEDDGAHHVHLARNLTSTNAICGDGRCDGAETASSCRQDCGNLRLKTADVGGRGAQGVMFYVRARRDLSITSIDIYSGTKAANQRVQVYTRPGKYANFETSSNGWTLVHDTTLDLLGRDRATLLGKFDQSVAISKSGFQSFFIWTPNNRIRYKLGETEGALHSKNAALNFYEGVGKTTKFGGQKSEHVHSPRVFSGVVRYEAANFSTQSRQGGSTQTKQGGDILARTTAGSIPIATRGSCPGNQRRVRLKMKTDKHGYENSYSFRRKGASEALIQGPDSTRRYESLALYEGSICVDVGFYELTMVDKFKDGMCCAAGRGYYSVEVQGTDGRWNQVVKGGNFLTTKKHVIDVGKTESTMTDRDKEYLVAHNKRRIYWHDYYNKPYRPLQWSQGLKESSMEYAKELLDTCQVSTPKHAKNNPWGENIARNQGGGHWGQLYSPDKIVGRFVDREVNLPWARNGHLTNALWRATKYVGCAEADKSYYVTGQNGNKVLHTCRAQVCRYAKPGNCSMGRYRNANGKQDWVTPMLMDDSPCKPDCPPEGCYDQMIFKTSDMTGFEHPGVIENQK
ncbi:hypothetical protein ACHAXT_011699 [Thalassiosira profunda]